MAATTSIFQNLGTNAGTAAEQAQNTSKSKDASSLNAWKDEAKGKILNLSTSNADILKYITDAATDENNSAGKTQILNYLLNLRAEMGSLLTNTLRTLFDTSAAVIRNIRD